MRMNDEQFLRKELSYYQLRAYKLELIVKKLLTGTISSKEAIHSYDTELLPSTQITETDEQHDFQEEETLPNSSLSSLIRHSELCLNPCWVNSSFSSYLPSTYLV